ncbi:MAG: DUF4139 domain-containing protein [Bacteroidia bacterium]
MKNYNTLFLILFFAAARSFASEKPQEIKAPITSVKICLNAAQITHTQKVKIKPGINKLAFTGLAMNINSRNISLRNIGGSELLSLRLVKLSDTTNIFSLPEDLLEMIKRSKDSILILEKNIEKVQFEIGALDLERTILLTNTNVIQNGKTLADLKMTSDYYRERYAAVNMEMLNKDRELKELKKNKVRALKSAFDIENSEESNISVSIIVADLKNPGAEYSADLELTYLAKESGWIPVYEIYASDNKALKINYRAKILNRTGIDWDDMNVTLSTADPFEYYSAPDLDPFYVTRGDRPRINEDSDEEDNSNQAQNAQKTKPKTNEDEEEIYTPDREITFSIAKKYNFKSGSTPSFVDVTSYDVTPDFLFRCAPKKEEQVYSVARLKDWEKLNLIDGEASIYNNGKFLGKSYIRPSAIEDYLELPLGVVDNIFVKRKLISETSSKKVFAGGITANSNYEIKIKNNSSDKISVEVIDQVPVSEEYNVKTEDVEFTEGGDRDLTTGKIIWKLDMAPSSDKTLFLKYSVSYPRGYSYSGFYKKRRVRSKF